MKKKLIIFGNLDLAQLAHYYFTHDSEYEVAAFTVDRNYLNCESFENKPLVAFEELEDHFSPLTHHFFAPITQAGMGKLRAQKFLAAKEKGFKCATYISSKTTYFNSSIGENCFILEDNTIQPFSKIGDNVTLWSGNHIGHHSNIHDHVFITSHVVVSGHVDIGAYSFLGVNSTIRDGISLGEGSLIGMGAVIQKSTEPYGIYTGAVATRRDGKRSDEVM
jgi:sugar O-acyltransferase (sialic acid O-acetyltransferase NeuD family)